jgi:uncharacterized protein YqhQ
MASKKTDSSPEDILVGGQAVIEGVMMRTPHAYAVAVRHADGSIEVKREGVKRLSEYWKPLSWPVVRGFAVLLQSLVLGIRTLNFSFAAAAADIPPKDGEAPEPKKKGGEALPIAVTMIVAAAFAVFLFILAPLWITNWLKNFFPAIHNWVVFNLVDGIIRVLFFLAYILLISRMKDIRRVFQYHGAEHKSIRAFEAGAELTVAETVPFSRLHERCGTSFIVVVVGASILVYIALSPLIPRDTGGGVLFQVVLILAKILLLGPVAAIAYEINRLAGKYWRSPLARLVAWPGLLMQRLLTTREPSADQIAVALTARRAALAFGPDDAGGARDPGWRLREFASFEKFVAEDGGEPRVAPGRSEAA